MGKLMDEIARDVSDTIVEEIGTILGDKVSDEELEDIREFTRSLVDDTLRDLI